MKTSNIRRILWTALSAAVVIGMAAAPVAGAVKAVTNSNAQSIMISTSLDASEYIIGTEETWSYNRATAAAFFSNVWDGNAPVARCNGNQNQCGTQPAAPAAPAPDASRPPAIANVNGCNFWNGDTLTIQNGQATYTQKVTSTVNTKWDFTYTYRITAPVPDARTAWDRTAAVAGSETAWVTLDGFVAGQSTLSKVGKDWTFKVSHTMADSEGNARVRDLMATLVDADGNVLDTQELDAVLERGVSFDYAATPGFVNGDVNQLIASGNVDAIQQGLLASPSGLRDNHAGNDFTGADRAVFATSSWPLSQAGAYSLVLSGAVKGVAGSVDAPFSVVERVIVHGPSC